MRSDRFLRACRKEAADRTPVWIMRQAGRYLPEYREIRRRHDFLTMCKTPELAAEVTLQPIDRVGVDAAIIFADILLPLEGMGLDLTFREGEGPVVRNPVRSVSDAQTLRPIEAAEELAYVMEAIRIVRRELDGKVPVIGFAGAPFTVASYAVEGRSSRDYRHCKTMMWAQPEAWRSLMERLTDATLGYLRAQVDAGAQAVQLFDSWAGALSPDDYRTHVLPYSRRICEELKDAGVPVIHFANQTSSYLSLVAETGADVIGLDWRIGMREAREALGPEMPVQGNLDPMTLFAPPSVIQKKVRAIIHEAQSAGQARAPEASKAPGHIFNLGHGIHKETPVEHVQAMVEAVHDAPLPPS